MGNATHSVGRTALIVVGCVALTLHALLFLHAFRFNAVDDAYISFRYAENLANGKGLVFNAGERVEGYSNFLWVMLLSGLAALGFEDLTLPATMLGMAFGIATLVLCVLALERVFNVRSLGAHMGVVLLVAGSGYYASWCIAGLETGLHAFLLVAGLLRYCIELEADPGARDATHWGSALVFAALTLTRPEGAEIALAAALVHMIASVRRGRALFSRTTLLLPAVVLTVIVIYTAWRFAYFGPHLHPNSVRAKIGGGTDQLLRGLSYFARKFCLPYLPLFLAALLTLRRPRAGAVLGLTLWCVWLAVFTIAGGDWSHGRFFAPLLPLGCVLCIGALWRVVQSAHSRSLRRAFLVIMTAYAYVCFHYTTVRRELPHRRTYGAGDAERVAIGRWLAETMPPDTKLAAFAIGQLSYYSKLYMHDMLGITDSHIARVTMPNMGQGTPGHEKSDIHHTLEVVSPEIIFDGRLVPMLERQALFRRRYRRVDSFWSITEVAVRDDFLPRFRAHLPAPHEGENP